jgi:hypothetical protein
MYRRAPADLQCRTWVMLETFPIHEQIEQMEKQGAPKFDVWFPPTPGTSACREEMLRNLSEFEKKGRVEVK